MLLLTTRTSLVRIEAAEALRATRKRLVLVTLLALCAFFCWALVLAGGVAALAAWTGCAWHWVALGAALLHLLVALALFNRAKQPLPPAFETTMAEFRKDREWILKL